VVVATRMSLSFPVLLSAVPLHLRTPGGAGALTRVWLSDGGICSNFPVHFFDAPLPRWPTFAINLRPLAAAAGSEPAAEEVVWLPEQERERDAANDVGTPWFTFRPSREREGLAGFLGAIADTAQNWHDSVQLGVPGYRDRVVHVGLRADEGGLNLAMDPAVIDRLAERGRDAADKLSRAFGDPGGDGYWDTHRWTRFRAFLAAAEQALADLDRAYRNEDDDPARVPPLPERPTYPDLAGRRPGEPPATDFDWHPDHREALVERAGLLVAVARAWVEQGSPSLAQGGPAPPARLRLSPRL
jgi:hypothetical protein